jgi:DNA polymerase delta subunit 1
VDGKGLFGIRMYGVTQVSAKYWCVYEVTHLVVWQEGHSVMAYITDFLPYFYIGMPRGFQDSDMNSFKEHLNVRLFICPEILVS